MIAIFAVQTTIEIIAALLLIWGFINEKKFIAFENKLAHAIAVNIRNYRRRKLAEQKQVLLNAQQPLPAKPFCVPYVMVEYSPKLQDCQSWVA
ncbi:MAG: hypothetical protein WCN92_02020 [Eubacteriales bacterium]